MSNWQREHRAIFQAVECRRCAARPGERCTAWSGADTTPHVVRMRRAYAHPAIADFSHEERVALGRAGDYRFDMLGRLLGPPTAFVFTRSNNSNKER